jgi:alkylation response protein AidB-like acyl-CoA dehydrogenase
MDFAYSEDQQALRELARKILEERATHDRLKEVKKTAERVDLELWRELAKANLLGVAIPEALGGTGTGLPELVILLEEIGRTVAPLPALPTLVEGALPIAAFGSEAQKKRWLPAVAAGDAILTAALADGPGAGVVAKPDGAGFRLTGRRPLVHAAHVAQAILVPAKLGGADALFLVDPKAAGVSLERAETTDEQIRPHLGLANAPAEALGDPARGAEALAWTEARALLGLCAMQVGVAERALQITARYVTERRQFDRPVGSFQAVHTRAGDAYVDLQAMRLTTWRALHLLEQGEAAADELAIAKFWASEGGARITYAAQHLHGGIGVDVDYPVHRYYLWARQIGLHLGTGTAQLAKLGERLAASS